MGKSSYREVTISAVVFGILIGAVMNASITYAGLKIAFTIGGSAIAAVLGFGVLRGLLRRGSILETNISQTVASAVNTPNSGVIFTVPVLFLLAVEFPGKGYDFEFGDRTFWLITVACIIGSILGCAFIIPVRKQMLDIDRLRFPTGTAVAAILKSPGAGPRKSLVLLAGALISAVIFLPAGLPIIKPRANLDELDDLVAREKITLEEAKTTRRIAPWVEAGKIPQDVIDKGKQQQAAIDAETLKKSKADAVALFAFQISQGEKSIDDLKNRFWAKSPFPGYSDLNWRLAAPETDDEAAWKEADRDDPQKYGHRKPDLLLHDDSIDVGRLFGMPAYLPLVFAIAPFSFGAGYITGRPGLVVLFGAILAFFILNPLVYSLGYLPPEVEPHQVGEVGHKAFNRPIGIGMLLGGALMGILFALPAIRAAFKSIASAKKTGGGADELGLKVLATAGAVCFVGLYLAAYFIRDPAEAKGGLLSTLPMEIQCFIIAAIGMVWIWFAGIIISQCAGMTDWSPISGMALITVVLILALGGTGDVLGAVLIGATLCVAVTCAADMMQDLKTGYLVGAKPIRQQVVELACTGLGPVICMATVMLLHQNNEFGSKELPAPQAQALKTVIIGVQGGEMPYVLYGCGALLAVGLGLGAFPGLGVLVGLSMYLPIEYILPYGVGCLAHMLVVRVKGKAWAEEWGVPFCAGLIVGEPVLAIFINGIALAIG